MDNLTFGSVIKQRRELYGLSLRKAAKLLDISFAQLCDLENGVSKNPTASTLNTIRRNYKIGAKTLLDLL